MSDLETMLRELAEEHKASGLEIEYYKNEDEGEPFWEASYCVLNTSKLLNGIKCKCCGAHISPYDNYHSRASTPTEAVQNLINKIKEQGDG